MAKLLAQAVLQVPQQLARPAQRSPHVFALLAIMALLAVVLYVLMGNTHPKDLLLVQAVLEEQQP